MMRAHDEAAVPRWAEYREKRSRWLDAKSSLGQQQQSDAVNHAASAARGGPGMLARGKSIKSGLAFNETVAMAIAAMNDTNEARRLLYGEVSSLGFYPHSTLAITLLLRHHSPPPPSLSSFSTLTLSSSFPHLLLAYLHALFLQVDLIYHGLDKLVGIADAEPGNDRELPMPYTVQLSERALHLLP